MLSNHRWPLNHYTDAGLTQHHLTSSAFCSPDLSCKPASFPSLPDTGQLWFSPDSLPSPWPFPFLLPLMLFGFTVPNVLSWHILLHSTHFSAWPSVTIAREISSFRHKLESPRKREPGLNTGPWASPKRAIFLIDDPCGRMPSVDHLLEGVRTVAGYEPAGQVSQ